MSKYRKKPVVIEANQWFRNGDHPLDNSTKRVYGEENFGDLSEGEVVRYYRHPSIGGDNKCGCGEIMHYHGWIDTMEGGHIVCPGDWVVTGVAGEHYPCKPDIFAQTYELVE